MSLLRRRLMLMQQKDHNPNDYIEFADATLGGILAEKYGDGTGLTYAQAAAVTSFPDWGIGINDRSDITSFNEINYFTGLQKIGHICFRNTPNMVIDDLRLPSLVQLGGHVFQNSGLRKVSDLGSLSSLYTWDYSSCFQGCAKLTSIRIPDSLGAIPKRMFSENPALCHIDIGAGCINVEEQFLFYCTALQTLVLRSPAVIEAVTLSFMSNVPTDARIYVPDAIVETYKVTSPWSGRADQFYPLSEYIEL